MDFQFAPSREAVADLLRKVDLPADDVDRVALDDFIVCLDGDDAVGLVGLEIGEGVALLRSLSVSPSRRGTGLGRELVRRAERHAVERGAESVYILTTTARAFFSRAGYRDLSREDAPAFIRNTREFSGICPGTAAFMFKRLDKGGAA